jgi:hypothetical protein
MFCSYSIGDFTVSESTSEYPTDRAWHEQPQYAAASYPARLTVTMMEAGGSPGSGGGSRQAPDTQRPTEVNRGLNIVATARAHPDGH